MRRNFLTSITKEAEGEERREEEEEEEEARTRERWGGAAKTGQIETLKQGDHTQDS
jgi:hypothetical protein